MQQFGTIVVVGGGCYGGYYVRQLSRARAAGFATWSRLVVVDRNALCLVSTLQGNDRPPGLSLQTVTWEAYFSSYLGAAAERPLEVANAAIVPSPLMPHLLAEWLVQRARDRWPTRRIVVEPLGGVPGIPWQMTGADGTQYVSFAEWVCPINCIEPARCPATRGDRSWSLPPALASYADDERAAGRPVVGPFVFHCAHRTHGVGMIDVRDVIAADATIAALDAAIPTTVLVGTASHCHGALQRIGMGSA
ncbi:MAG: hypothetical protein H7247_13965 [Polaromonas sp.]|nr:hypothetical protein [Gemmatimonadaceae bacterium]